MRRPLLAVALAAVAVAGAGADDRDWLAPPALVRGDAVALVAPCGIPDERAGRRLAAAVDEAGFRVEFDPAIARLRHRYLAGTDAERADEINRAIRNPEVRGIFVVRGFTNENERAAILAGYCPSLLFPFAREAVSDFVQKAGFPQLLLQPINFEALFLEHVSRQRAAAGQAGADANVNVQVSH